MKRKLSAGLTSVSLPIFVGDTSSTTGGGLASLVYNTGSLVAEYRRQGQSSWTAITLVTKTLGTWVSGGFIADGALSGAYELDLPDAVTAIGARWAAVRLRGATNMLPALIEIELDAVNYQDAQRFGLAALPASGTLLVDTGDAYARIGATGSGLTSLASQASVNTIDDFLDTEVAAIKAKTDQLTFTVTNSVDATATVSLGATAPANWINAASIAADAGTEIGVAVWAGAPASTPLSAIAAAIWDEPRAGHTTAATFGNYLDSAVSGVSTGGVSAGDIADAVWADMPAGTPLEDIADAVWAEAPVGTPVEDIADAVWAGMPAGTPLEDIAEAVITALPGSMIAGTVVASPSPTTTTLRATVDVVPTDIDQFQGRVIIFDKVTTTPGLRGQATDIINATAPGSGQVGLTFTNLTTAPVTGDIFVIV